MFADILGMFPVHSDHICKNVIFFLTIFFFPKVGKIGKIHHFSCCFWVDFQSSLREAFSEQYETKKPRLKWYTEWVDYGKLRYFWKTQIAIADISLCGSRLFIYKRRSKMLFFSCVRVYMCLERKYICARFVDSNQLYEYKRSFLKSFEKFAF